MNIANRADGGSIGLFGKKKLSEIKAAGQFVHMVAKGVQQNWPEIVKELNSMLFHAGNPISDDQYASYEFLLAVITSQIQVLPNLLPLDQASRIREYVMQCIFSADLGSYPCDTIEEYQRAWDQSLQKGEPPFYGIASVLFDKLDCRSIMEIGEARFKSPLILMALAEKVVTFGGPWWKTVTQEYTLVP